MLRAHWEVSGLKTCTRIIPEKNKSMAQCQAHAGPTLKAVYHLCGSIGPMSSVSRYSLWQCGNAIIVYPIQWPMQTGIPVNTRRRTHVGQMLARRHRRWDNINPTPDQRLVSAGMSVPIRISSQKNVNIDMSTWQCHDQNISVAPIPMCRTLHCHTDTSRYFMRICNEPNIDL